MIDRIGGGDGFAAGLIYGLLAGRPPEEALRLGWAHGALLTTFPGDVTHGPAGRSRSVCQGRARPACSASGPSRSSRIEIFASATRPEDSSMEKWPIGVFASIDAGLGVRLEVAHELGVPTIQLHAPAQAARTPEQAKRFLDGSRRRHPHHGRVWRLRGRELRRHSHRRPNRRPGAARNPRRATREMKEIADFARLLGVDVVGAALGLCAARRAGPATYRDVLTVTRDICDHCRGNGQALHLETGSGTGRHAADRSSATSSATTCSSTSTRPT